MPEPPDYLAVILGVAFEQLPGEHYNRRLEELTASGDRLHHWVFYEISLRENWTRTHILEAVYPALLRYMHAKLLIIDETGRVVVAVFFQEDCYLIKAADFIAAVRQVAAFDNAPRGLLPG